MEFTLSTKPFADALDLGVINANISKFYSKSCLAQLTATKHTLRINLEAVGIYTEVILKGSGDVDEEKTTFVDCAVLKQLVGTFDANVTQIVYTEGGIILHSGSSKFTLPSMLPDSAEGAELARPEIADMNAPSVTMTKSDWSFVKDHQLYALATSFALPIYTKVWLGKDGDVIVGDYDNSLFTFSNKNKLGETCLVPDTIINLLTSLPDGAQITKLGTGYRIDVKTDGFEYSSQFFPQVEGEDGIGDYNAPIFLGLVDKDANNCIKMAVSPVSKFLSQSDLVSSSSEEAITLSYDNQEIRLSNSNGDTQIKVESTCSTPFKIDLDSSLFKSVLSNSDVDVVNITPKVDESDGSVGGIVVWSADLAVALGALEEE